MSHVQAISNAVHYLQHAADPGTGQIMGLAGCWKLAHGRALTLLSGQAGELRVAHGRVWVTFDDAGQDVRVRAGDYFLEAGQSMAVPAGCSVVMESFAAGEASAAYFSWQPAAQPRGVVQLFGDLLLALQLVAGAARRLLRGLAVGLLGGVRV